MCLIFFLVLKEYVCMRRIILEMMILEIFCGRIFLFCVSIVFGCGIFKNFIKNEKKEKSI